MIDTHALLEAQRSFFRTGATRDIAFRMDMLRRFRKTLLENEGAVYEALAQDLKKPPVETCVSEFDFVLREVDFALRHLRSWTRPEKIRTNFLNLPGRSRLYREPYGVALIIGPWNYPIQLILGPLVGAMAAGNCCVIKPSELAPASSRVAAAIVSTAFDRKYIAAVEGGRDASEALLAERFDHIFFTGSMAVGRIVMEAAAKHLTPVTLELGGKSPAIVDADADLSVAARRIAWGKFINAGQTCVAPDYLLLHRSVNDAFLDDLGRTIRSFYGDDPASSPDYARIINDRHFDRLAAYLSDGDIIIGGRSIREERYISPTVLTNVPWDAPIMQEEIFGPLLPVLLFDDTDDIADLVNQHAKPLALYYFGRDQGKRDRIVRDIPFGGGAVNDTILHFTNPHLPFGGVGPSGFGSYHGKAGFEAFSHRKSMLRMPTFFDNPLRYPPYSKRTLAWLKRLFRWDR